MSVIDTLISNRTAADVALVKQLAAIGYANMTTAQKNQWDTDLKGAYNASDMNRVGEAINYLVAELNQYYQYTWDQCESMDIAWDEYWSPTHWEPSWHILSITARTNWGAGGIPQAEDLEEYLSQVREVTSMIALTPYTLPTTMEYLTYEGANQIEELLSAEHYAVIGYADYMYELMNGTRKAWFYSGDLYGGEL